MAVLRIAERIQWFLSLKSVFNEFAQSLKLLPFIFAFKGHSGQKIFPRFFSKNFDRSDDQLHKLWAFYNLPFVRVSSRGGVEDTRLEAKAKDTKKSEAKAKDSLSEDRHSRGQGQECSRPRTKRKCSQKKKGLHKNFSSDLHKKTFSKQFFKRSTKL